MSGPSKPRASFEFTDACAPFVPRVLTVSGLIALAALLLIHSGSAARVQAAPSRSYASASGLRIIFGLKDRMTGKSWNGSVVDRHKCGPVREVDLGRNRIIWSRRPDAGTDPRRVEFTFRDTQQFGVILRTPAWLRPRRLRPGATRKPASGIGRPGRAATIYVRVIQSYSTAKPDLEGEIAWSSRIFVQQK